ncbi:MAG: Fis family transcriptional regulator [Alteromonadaceae bacterium]|jgi:hypothetical protein|tara:strand:- start:814 stop:1212 length:399 start_codon:yes stop_codon:yes gene_type:complete
MKLNKTTKKIDDNICKALTIVCESEKTNIDGFIWLTHRANYTNFPASLIVTCVFDIDAEVKALPDNKQGEKLMNSIQKQLLKVGIVAKNIRQNVHFDSEESCLREHQGKWENRLKLKVTKQKPNAKNNQFPS